MSHLYWNPPLLSSLVATHNMTNNKNLKRTRSTESLEKALKRSRPFYTADSPASVSSEPIFSTIKNPLSPPQLASTSTTATTAHLYPTIVSPPSPTSLKSFSISTKTERNNISPPPPPPPPPSPPPPAPDYSNVNGMLYDLHVQRFGDPEIRESWWKDQDQDIDMEEINDEYSSANSILRQAFLQRRRE
ncbi:hypothetical protein INT46_010239 [Mucor plumbeus]|uniref:Uncharacterized protein n=1 Tax=Mucor plumbeus TaxID=97098 RepID=A0A8H7QPH5_9FUNG|nr:hypothetical protein INT46_010239 [Mucor plumbeus]